MIITITIPDVEVPIIEAQINRGISGPTPIILKADVWITQQVQFMIDQCLQQDKRNQLVKYGLMPTTNIDQATIDKLKLTLTPIA